MEINNNTNIPLKDIEIIKDNIKTAQRSVVLIIYLCDTEEEQLDLWHKWEELEDNDRMHSDQLSQDLYGMDNEEVNIVCLEYLTNLAVSSYQEKNAMPEKLLNVDQAIKSVIISDTEEELIKKQVQTSGVLIIYKERDFRRQMLLWNRWRIMNSEFRKLSDQMSQKICGITNEDHHRALMAYWKENLSDSSKDELVGETTVSLYALKGNLPITSKHHGTIDSILFRNKRNGKVVILNSLLDEQGNSQAFYTVLKENETVDWANLFNFEKMNDTTNLVYSLLVSEETLSTKLQHLKTDYFIQGSVTIFKHNKQVAVFGSKTAIEETYNFYKDILVPMDTSVFAGLDVREVALNESFNFANTNNYSLLNFLNECTT